jgi:hypothetical protein
VLRPFLSLVVAAGGTVVGLSLTGLGAAAYSRAAVRLITDPGALLLTVIGVVLLGIAALSLAIHWVGVIVVGAIHGLLGLLALVVPFGNPFAGGIFSPVFQITRMLASFDATLSEGATVFYFSGAALVVGAFLVGAALGVRSGRLAGPSSAKAVAVSSSLGGLALLGATALLVIAGGTFVRMILVTLRYDAALAGLTVAGGLLAGLGGLLLRWSSTGVLLVGGIVLGAGILFFVAPGTMPGVPGDLVWSYGLAMVAGVTFLAAAAAGATVRGRDEVPVRSDAL